MAMCRPRIDVVGVIFFGMSLGTAVAACQGMAVHAHRGAPSAPENSLSAYVASVEGSWDGMETDIQQLRDGTWVLHHDALTGRVVSAGTTKPTSQLSSSEWRSARMKSRNGQMTDEKPPFLSQLAEAAAVNPQKTLNIEIKQPSRGCAPIQDVVYQLSNGMRHGNWFLTSIDRENLRCVRKYDKQGYLGLIVIDPKKIAEKESSAYARQLSRHLQSPSLTKQWLMILKQQVGAPLGIHVDAETLLNNPKLLADASELGLSVFTYSLYDDVRHAELLAKIRSKSRLLPSGAVIDGGPQQFCDALKANI